MVAEGGERFEWVGLTTNTEKGDTSTCVQGLQRSPFMARLPVFICAYLRCTVTFQQNIRAIERQAQKHLPPADQRSNQISFNWTECHLQILCLQWTHSQRSGWAIPQSQICEIRFVHLGCWTCCFFYRQNSFFLWIGKSDYKTVYSVHTEIHSLRKPIQKGAVNIFSNQVVGTLAVLALLNIVYCPYKAQSPQCMSKDGHRCIDFLLGEDYLLNSPTSASSTVGEPLLQ